MKLNSRKVYPENGTLCFAVNNRTSSSLWGYKYSSGFVGVVLFENGKWHSMPDKLEISEDNDFLWIELNNQPERSKREDCKLDLEEILCAAKSPMWDHCCVSIRELLKELQMRCSEHCGKRSEP